MNTRSRVHRVSQRALVALAGALAYGAPLTIAAAKEATDRATAFRAAKGQLPVEEVPGGLLMVAAYAAIWLLVFAFVWRMARKQAALERVAEDLERRLEPRGGSSEQQE